MRTTKLLAAISAVAISAGASQAAAQEMQPGIFMVAKDASQKINRFGVCKVVKNGGVHPVMVPAGTPQQWSTGKSAFLNNISGMPGVSVKGCVVPKNVDGCHGSGPSYFSCLGRFGSVRNDPSNPPVHWAIFHNKAAHGPLSGGNDYIIDVVDIPEPSGGYTAKQIEDNTVTLEAFCSAPGRQPGIYAYLFNYPDTNVSTAKWLTCE